jgi:hypothetical protein
MAHAPPAAAGKGKWIAIGIVLIVVLVGGGALAGYLARGGNKGTHDAGVASGSSAVAIVADAGTVPSAPDASTAAKDPWSERVEDPLGTGAATESDGEGEDEDEVDAQTEAMIRAQAEMARGMLSETQKKQMRQQLALAEKALGQLEKTSPGLYQQQLVSYVTAACYLGDAAMAQRNYEKIVEPMYRQTAKSGCKNMGLTLVDKASNKKM